MISILSDNASGSSVHGSSEKGKELNTINEYKA
jgi:hypothetical protein